MQRASGGHAISQVHPTAKDAFPGKIHFLSDRGSQPDVLYSNLYGLQVIASKLCILIQLWLR